MVNSNTKNKDFYINKDNYFYGWLQNKDHGYTGLYWESKNDGSGDILSPKKREDSFLRSDKAGGFVEEVTGANNAQLTREYVRWTLDNEVGFVNSDGTWNFKTDNKKNAYVYNNLEVTRNITAEYLYGDGSNITNINAMSIKTGLLSKDRLPKVIEADTTGNAGTSTSLAKEIKITLSGDTTGILSFDGSIDKEFEVTVLDDSHKHEKTYYNKSISDNRFLSITGTANNSQLLAGKDIKYFATDDNLKIQQDRIDDILNLSSTDLDSFKEVVDLIKSIDIENDNNLATFSKKISKSISDEVTRATSTEETIKALNTTEVARAKTEENKISEQLNTKLDTEISNLTSSQNKLKDSLNNEINKTTKNEVTINANLNKEIFRAMNEEQKLQDEISSNSLKNSNSLKVLDGKISTETLRASTSEQDLTTKIIAEFNRATKSEKDINALIKQETLRAVKSEKENSQNIAGEILRASSKEKEIFKNANDLVNVQKARIDDILNLSTTDLDSFKEIVDLIKSVDTKDDKAFSTFVVTTNKELKTINTTVEEYNNRAIKSEKSNLEETFKEVVRAKGVEKNLQDQINNNKTSDGNEIVLLKHSLGVESTRAVSVEKDINSNLNSEISRATKVEDGIIKTISTNEKDTLAKLHLIDAKIITTVATETTRAKVTEENITNSLTNRIKIEEQTARLNEKDIDENISKINIDLKTETDRAILQEKNIEVNLNNEIKRAKDKEDLIISDSLKRENEIETKVDTLTSDTQKIEKNINLSIDKLNTSVVKDIKDISDLKTLINTESEKRLEEDKNLNTNITNESTRAVAAETKLQSEISKNQNQLDGILNLSSADKDSFKEIVDYINSVNTKTDATFGKFIISTDKNFTQATDNLNNEITRAEKKEDDLNALIVTESKTARSNEKNLNILITNVSNDISTESNRAEKIEKNINHVLDTEITTSRNNEKTITNNLNTEITRAKEEESKRYLSTEVDKKFLKVDGVAEDSDKLNNQNLDDFKTAYLKALDNSTIVINNSTYMNSIETDETPVYWDDVKSINFSNIKSSPIGNIISLNVIEKGNDLPINGKFNQNGTRIEFLKNEKIIDGTTNITYLTKIKV